jgi:hypothetical protein
MEEALNKYYEHFGENYPLGMGNSLTEEEVIERVEHCIKTNTKEAEPVYEDEYDY